MSDTLWSDPDKLRRLLTRAAQLASCSGRTLMESAGLSWQSLSAWKAGTRTPRPNNVKAVGHVLLLRAEKLEQLGRDLIDAAEAEERIRRPKNNEEGVPTLPLFGGDTA